MNNTQIAEQQKAIVRKLYDEVLTQGKIEVLETICSPDFEMTLMEYNGRVNPKGPGAFETTVKTIHSSFPDIRYTIDDIFAEGNEVIARWSWTGTHQGAFREFPASHNHVTNYGMSIFRFDGDKIVSSWTQTDRLGFLQQIDALPKPKQP